MDQQVLLKLTETMDDVKERVIRIEEGLKDVHALKSDVSNLKVAYSSVDSSTKSSHKRLDELEKKVGQVLFWVSTTVIGALIVGLIGLAVFKK